MQLSIVAGKEAASALPAQPLHVLKFGSSILQGISDLPRVAGEIYRQRRAGRRIVAVVSALAGETDALLAQAAAVAGSTNCRGFADLVSLGEERSAALLRIACDRIGLIADICRPEELGLRTEGDVLDALPTRLDKGAIEARLAETGVVIVPGYVGLDEAGERTLLGRGGSDLSAIFLAGELGAEKVRLYKDVEGVFDRDPALAEDALHYPEIEWNEALEVAGRLIQPAAIRHAGANGLTVEIGAIGGSDTTIVGPRSLPAEPLRQRRPLRIALAGFGVVGQGLAARLKAEKGFEIVSVLVRDLGRTRAVNAPAPLTADVDAFLATPADIVVDALSCEQTGAGLSARSLPAGVHVVSASKRVIAQGKAALTSAAREGGSSLLYSAAVGGAAPVLETVAAARAEGEIAEVAAILNGTVNYILDRMASGLSFADALVEAQKAGFAEEDSRADLSGADAAAKLKLVAAEAFGGDPATVEVGTEGLDADSIARIAASGERWVQLARIANGVASVTLRPARECESISPLPAEWNCAAVTLADGRVFRCAGRGAGGAATAEAIVADLFEIAEAANAAASASSLRAVAC